MASESPPLRPPLTGARPVAPKRGPVRIQPRTLRGLLVALGLATLVLVNYHVLRPWAFRHGVRVYLDEDVMGAAKAVMAFSAIGLSVWALIRRLQGRPFKKSAIRAALVVYSVLGVAAYISADDLGSTFFVHRWELFHYYLGSKYPRELGYKRLYVCAAIAQSEFGEVAREEVMARKIRDLATDVMKPAAPVLEHPELCKDHFSPARWEEFKSDVDWFRNSASREFWEGMSTDHGYNPPPVWTTIGHLVDYFSPNATATSMLVLGSIDTYLFALLFFAVWWAFGLPTLCAVLVFWGAQLPANGYFTGGAYLRQDWLLFLVLASCLLRRHYWALAGAALATSALLRVFPVFFFAGIVVVAATHYQKHRRVAKHHARFFAGAIAGGALLVALSVAVTGARSYKDFAEHIELHHKIPATNNMGLSVLLSFTPEGRAEHTRDRTALDEFGHWADVHTAALERRRPAFLAINAFVLLVFVLAVRRVRSLWIAMGLSAVLAVTVPTLSCYYYSFLIAPAILSKVSMRVALLTLFAAGLSSVLLIIGRVSFQYDDRFTIQSLVFLGYAFGLVLAFLPPNADPKAAPRRGAQLARGAP